MKNRMNWPALLAATLLVTACGKTAPPAKTAQPVLVMTVGAPVTSGADTFAGEVHARYETVLGFRVGGKIAERLVDAGARVKAGQPLARLDPADLIQQEAQALAQQNLADADARRYRDLKSKGFISPSALEARETALAAAVAQGNLARNQKHYATLVADADGVITAVSAEPGQVVAAGQPVFRLARQGEREVQIAVPESRIAALKQGTGVEVALWARPDKTYAGKVREVTPNADAATRTFPVRVSIADADEGVALGMSASVRFRSPGAPTGINIPATAVFQAGDRPAVWVLDAEDKVALRPVTVAPWADEGVIVTGGLAPGERIAAAGVHKLTAGEKVQVVVATPAAQK